MEKNNHATHYTYDIHGNVKELIQDNPDMTGTFASHRYKKMQYSYDLISGKVNRVDYQLGKRDMFSHEYFYDSDNRITNVYTSRDGGYSWDQDAKYYYYLHGPLARTEIGHHKVQGLDYAYTLQGWIKGVNSNNLDANNDMGKDGYDDLVTSNSTTFIHNYAARDAFGYNLNYYATDVVDDYIPVDGNIYSNQATYAFAKLYNGGTYDQLFNGNISSMGTGFLNLDASMSTIPNTSQSITKYATYSQLKQFRYDQLNRIRHAAATSNYVNGNNEWDYIGGGAVTQYSETFVYDQNGNIKSANRWSVQTNATIPTLDGLLYYYYTKTGSTFLPGSAPSNATNKLAYVREAVVSAATDDIENQSPGNYGYDANGNLVRDVYEEIGSISWSTYGKIKSIVRTGGSSKFSMDFKYDAMGNRVSKRTYKTTTDYTTTYYVRDAQGNVMATYEKDFQASAPAITLKLKELNIYGSSRLGNLTTDYLLATTGSGGTVPSLHARTLGNKNYELINHLDNVLAVVTDRKLQVDANADGTTDYFMPDMLNTTDYYSFGAPMGGGRKYQVTNRYRYGFNGKESDDEVKGAENSLDFGARINDPRLGKWLSVDPLAHEFPWQSPYASMDNNPICKIDPTGMGAEDFVKDKAGNIRWDKDANSQATTKEGETYLGKNLSFTFNSFIDQKLWDGPEPPVGKAAGDKITSIINLTATENEKGELTGLSATSKVIFGNTPVGKPRDHYPGKGGSNNVFAFGEAKNADGTLGGFSLNFEQHASVSKIEEYGLNNLGYKIVDVAQKLNITYGGGKLKIVTATNIFPSATLDVRNADVFFCPPWRIMHYPQPSFVKTHTAPVIMSSFNQPVGRDFSYYPSTFYQRKLNTN